MSNKSSGRQSKPFGSGQYSAPFHLRLVGKTLIFVAFALSACTQKARKSTLRDLQADAANQPTLKQMKIKYSFVFIGSSGKKYPIYMSADVAVSDGQKEALWNSAIDSDAGLTSASNESKTLKPDKDLQFKAQISGETSSPSVVVFTSGNPELGRGLSLSVQKVVASGATTWKAISLSYFGYDAQIEDSTLPTQTAASTTNPQLAK
ncbi:hypothetical protein EBU99_05455 [bacterium]|nr:hypothetical protein [bacterium]